MDEIKACKIDPVRMIKWVVDNALGRSDILVQKIIYDKNLTPEQLETLYDIQITNRAAMNRVNNITELFCGNDEIGMQDMCSYNVQKYISALVEQVGELFTGEYEDKIEFVCEVESFNAVFDSRRMGIILYNLLSNAIIHGTGKRKTIKLEGFIEANELVIAVVDNGKPIPKSKRKTMFTLDNAEFNVASDNICSLKGLGLAVCRKEAVEMGGEIVYLPSPKYNRFELRIPQNMTERYEICEEMKYVHDYELMEMCMAEAQMVFRGLPSDGIKNVREEKIEV